MSDEGKRRDAVAKAFCERCARKDTPACVHCFLANHSFAVIDEAVNAFVRESRLPATPQLTTAGRV